MRYLKRLGIVASVAVMASMALAGTASAQATEKAACQLTGVAGDIFPGVMLVGGSGGYSFEGSVVCRYMDGAGVPVTDTGTIVSQGTFDNIVCGTGTADGISGTTSVTFPAGSAIPDVSGVEYHIDFVGAQGVLEISDAVDEHGHHGTGNGEVTIIPSEGSCESPFGVTAFDVQGGFLLRSNH